MLPHPLPFTPPPKDLGVFLGAAAGYPPPRSVFCEPAANVLSLDPGRLSWTSHSQGC